MRTAINNLLISTLNGRTQEKMLYCRAFGPLTFAILKALRTEISLSVSM